MILRQPIPQRRRHQKRLLTITIQKVLTHPGIQLNPPDRPPLRDSLSPTRSRDPRRPEPESVVRDHRRRRTHVGETDRPDGRAGTSAFVAEHSSGVGAGRRVLRRHRHRRLGARRDDRSPGMQSSRGWRGSASRTAEFRRMYKRRDRRRTPDRRRRIHAWREVSAAREYPALAEPYRYRRP
jgi:hypothetical protein